MSRASVHDRPHHTKLVMGGCTHFCLSERERGKERETTAGGEEPEQGLRRYVKQFSNGIFNPPPVQITVFIFHAGAFVLMYPYSVPGTRILYLIPRGTLLLVLAPCTWLAAATELRMIVMCIYTSAVLLWRAPLRRRDPPHVQRLWCVVSWACDRALFCFCFPEPVRGRPRWPIKSGYLRMLLLISIELVMKFDSRRGETFRICLQKTEKGSTAESAYL